MSLTLPSAAPRVERGGGGTLRRASVFGLDVASPLSLVGFELSATTSPDATVRPGTLDELRSRWPAHARELRAFRFPNGRCWLRIEHAPGAGYRIWGLRHGTHVVSEDGRQIASAQPGWGGWRWQRLLFAQALPLAAQLHGFELLHASAVQLDGATIAFIASSGTGKSTLAANLVARGASLVTDDVLAVKRSGDSMMAYPGSALVGLTEMEYRRLPSAGRAMLGTRLGRADKLYFAAEMAREPAPLAAICFLRRGGEELELSLDEQCPPEPRQLLGSAFVSYLDTRDRLARHLASSADIAAATRVFTLHMPTQLSPPELAARVEERFRATLGEDTTR